MSLVKCDFDKKFSINPHQREEFYNKMAPTVVRVQHMASKNEDIYAEGGGVFVSESYVLTTSNLVPPHPEEGSRFLVYTKNNQMYEAIPLSISAPPDNLVQLLKIHRGVDALNFAGIAEEQLLEGFDVLFIGHSYGPAYSFTMGSVNFAQRSVKELNLSKKNKAIKLSPLVDKDKKILQVSQLYGGSEDYASLAEGCPMFNSSGEVVAIYGFSVYKFDYGFPVNKELVEGMLSQAEMQIPGTGRNEELKQKSSVGSSKSRKR